MSPDQYDALSRQIERECDLVRQEVSTSRTESTEAHAQVKATVARIDGRVGTLEAAEIRRQERRALLARGGKLATALATFVAAIAVAAQSIS